MQKTVAAQQTMAERTEQQTNIGSLHAAHGAEGYRSASIQMIKDEVATSDAAERKPLSFKNDLRLNLLRPNL